jgi:protein TonB
MPRYKGGNSKMSEYLSKNYKIDPNTFDHNFKVGFIVKENGELYDIKIIQNYPIPLTDSENQIIKVFESMKKWKAGSCNGKKVPVRVIIPIRFYLADWYE